MSAKVKLLRSVCAKSRSIRCKRKCQEETRQKIASKSKDKGLHHNHMSDNDRCLLMNLVMHTVLAGVLSLRVSP